MATRVLAKTARIVREVRLTHEYGIAIFAPEEQARERNPHCIVATAPYTQLDRAVIDDRSRGFSKLIADRRRELILGAHAVGENAIEVVQSVTTAMAAGIDVSTPARVKFAYPTDSAIIGLAARALLAQKQRPKRVR